MKRRTGRLGGEFDPGGIAEFVARALFLDAVENHIPEALQELREILPLVPEREKIQPIAPHLWRDIKAVEQCYPEYLPAVRALHKWAEKFNLAEPWILEEVGATLRHMKDGDAVGFALSSEAFWDIKPLVLRWYPTIESRKAFEERVKQALDEKEAELWRQGYEPTPEKRNTEHFAWLALYRVKGLTFREIADLYYDSSGKVLGEGAIRKGVEQAADAAGIAPRRGKTKNRK